MTNLGRLQGQGAAPAARTQPDSQRHCGQYAEQRPTMGAHGNEFRRRDLCTADGSRDPDNDQPTHECGEIGPVGRLKPVEPGDTVLSSLGAKLRQRSQTSRGHTATLVGDGRYHRAGIDDVTNLGLRAHYRPG